MSSPHLPIAQPLLGEPEARAAARVIRSGWVTQGPEVALFEQEFASHVGAPYACAVSNCTTALHLALLAVGRYRRRRGHHRQPQLHCNGQRHSPLRRHARLRRHRTQWLQYRSTADRRGDEPADPGDPLRTSARHALRPGLDRGDCPAPGRGADRGCRLRGRQRDRLAGPFPQGRRPDRGHRLLFLSSAQGHHHRRWRHADDDQRRI